MFSFLGLAVAAEPPAEPRWAPPVIHAAALLSALRVAEAVIWPDPFARTAEFGAHWQIAFTTPPAFDPTTSAFRWDGDPVVLNAIGHPLLGSELYLQPRRCGFAPAASLAFAATTSTLWEYGFEGQAKRPSALDLALTPLAGLALGEARHALIRHLDRRSSPGRRAARALLDPLGALGRALGSPC